MIRCATRRSKDCQSTPTSWSTVPDSMKRRAPGWRASYKKQDGRGRERSWVVGARGRKGDFRHSRNRSKSAREGTATEDYRLGALSGAARGYGLLRLADGLARSPQPLRPKPLAGSLQFVVQFAV